MVNKVRLGGHKTPDRPSSAPRTGKQRRSGSRDQRQTPKEELHERKHSRAKASPKGSGKRSQLLAISPAKALIHN